MDWKPAIDAAATRIAPYIQRTPVITTTGFGLGFPVEMKLEHMQHTGSFKPRGAFNTLLSRDVPEAGLVAASGGNHGAAVAYAARVLGHKAAIFVPEAAGPAKIGLIRRMGAELTVLPGEFANVMQQALDHEARTGAMQIHPYDAPATIEGQGTFMAEWEDQGLAADTILIAVGGGGLLSGAMGWLGGRRKIVAVEPELCATLHTALTKGPGAEITPSGVAVNALGARTIGRICHGLASTQDVTSVTVSDDAITAAQRALWQERRLLVEPGGATALAALMSGAYLPEADERVAVLICGGNIVPDPLQS